MQVYRDVVREVATMELFRRARALASAGPATDLLVEVGELEQAVLDTVHRSRDEWDDVAAAARAASLDAGRVFVAQLPRDAKRLDGSETGTATEGVDLPSEPRLRLLAALDRLERSALPPTLQLKAPEGYAYYGLDPAAYAEAAARFVDDAGARDAASALVIGVRSIGTGLSAVVAAVCGATRTVTVRPRGPSGQRRIEAAPRFLARLRPLLASATHVLIVDEGPGATGETFECVHAWLCGLGVAPTRIVLLVSRDGGMPLAPEDRRAWFATARKYALALDDDRAAKVAARLGLSEPVDLSAGLWRRFVPAAGPLPARTAFERLKYVAQDASGQPWQIRYVGLGRWRDELLGRARRLAEIGLAPPLQDGLDGFAAVRWIEGCPVERAARYDREMVDAVSRYVLARAGRFGTGTAVEPQPLVACVRENGEALPESCRQVVGPTVAALEALPTREASIPDGRLQPWEWLHTPRGIVKVDGLDHGDGFRQPGPADAAWDLAGAAVELGLDGPTLDAIVRGYAILTGDAEIGAAVSTYTRVYAITAYADALLSSREATSPEDRRRLLYEAAFYADRLRAYGPPQR